MANMTELKIKRSSIYVHREHSPENIGFSVFSSNSSYALVNAVYAERLAVDEILSWTTQSPISACREENGLVRTGRTEVRRKTLGNESIVIRRFMRGGLLAERFLGNRFFLCPSRTLAETRPIAELLVLSILFQAGLNVPLPVAAVSTRIGDENAVCLRHFYRAAIATREVANSENLLAQWENIKNRPDKSWDEFGLACRKAGIQARKMLLAGVFHSDLHVGNAIVDTKGEVHLIDFDRAVMLKSPAERVKFGERLLSRWDRSVLKHGITSLAIEEFARGLEAF